MLESTHAALVEHEFLESILTLLIAAKLVAAWHIRVGCCPKHLQDEIGCVWWGLRDDVQK